jgi:hypothetical protein
MKTKPQPDFYFSVKACLLRHPRLRTVKALADDLGLARNTVSVAINHPTMHPTVKARIKQHLRIAA